MVEQDQRYTGPLFKGEVWRRLRLLLKGKRGVSDSEKAGIAIGGLGGALLGPIGIIIGIPAGFVGGDVIDTLSRRSRRAALNREP